MYQRSEETWKKWNDPQSELYQADDYDRKDADDAYDWVARYTLTFLDGYLKKEAAAITFLRNTPAQNRVPKHFMTVRYRQATNARATNSYNAALEKDSNEDARFGLRALETVASRGCAE
jgi:hypothetical protein